MNLLTWFHKLDETQDDVAEQMVKQFINHSYWHYDEALNMLSYFKDNRAWLFFWIFYFAFFVSLCIAGVYGYSQFNFIQSFLSASLKTLLFTAFICFMAIWCMDAMSYHSPSETSEEKKQQQKWMFMTSIRATIFFFTFIFWYPVMLLCSFILDENDIMNNSSFKHCVLKWLTYCCEFDTDWIWGCNKCEYPSIHFANNYDNYVSIANFNQAEETEGHRNTTKVIMAYMLLQQKGKHKLTERQMLKHWLQIQQNYNRETKLTEHLLKEWLCLQKEQLQSINGIAT